MPFRRCGISAREFRIMASKRALVSVLATVCIIFGIYLGFFNHPPANETLAINLAHQDHKFVPFKHLHSRLHNDEKTSVLRALNISDTLGLQLKEDVSKAHLLRTAKLASINDTAQKNLSNSGANIRTNSQQIDKSGSHQKEDVPDEDPFKNIIDEDENQNDSGNNAGEEKTMEDKAEEDAEAEHMERNAGKSKEYGPHHIRIFDWDGWVKSNNYIDIGTIWAYCGESTLNMAMKL